MWDLIVSVPDHCLSFYCTSLHTNVYHLDQLSSPLSSTGLLLQYHTPTHGQKQFIGRVTVSQQTLN